jgi:hypothetical protein
MIEDWFEDTRECTQMQQMDDQPRDIAASEVHIDHTDGSCDVDEARLVLVEKYSAAPPVMLNPCSRNSRIVTPPSGQIALRMTPPCTSTSSPTGNVVTWMVAPDFAKVMTRSLSFGHPVNPCGRKTLFSGEHPIAPSQQDDPTSHKQKLKNEAAKKSIWLAPLSEAHMRSMIPHPGSSDLAFPSSSSMQLSVTRSRSRRNAIPAEQGSFQMDSMKMQRIRELTHESSENDVLTEPECEL